MRSLPLCRRGPYHVYFGNWTTTDRPLINQSRNELTGIPGRPGGPRTYQIHVTSHKCINEQINKLYLVRCLLSSQIMTRSQLAFYIVTHQEKNQMRFKMRTASVLHSAEHGSPYNRIKRSFIMKLGIHLSEY